MSSTSGEIVLYDLPSQQPCKCWSPNVWKTRLLLNYKGLTYRTEWMEYPEIRVKLENRVAPNKQGAAYTSPTIQLPDGTFVMDSKSIAYEIEKRHPEPLLHLDSLLIPKLEQSIRGLLMNVAPYIVGTVYERLITEASQAHYNTHIVTRFGGSLEELANARDGPTAWKNAKPHLDEVTDMLNEDDSGPYFKGSTVSYADFIWGAVLIFMQRIGSDQYEQLLDAASDSNAHIKLVKGLEVWSARQD